jgi:hypothetical protein
MQCIYQVHTSNVQIDMSLHMFQNSKKLPRHRIKPRIEYIASCLLNHCASSVDTLPQITSTFYTWTLVTYVRRRTSRPPRPRHGLASTIANSKSVIGCELETGQQARGWPWRRGCGSTLRLNGGTASDLKGGCRAVDTRRTVTVTDLLGHHQIGG